MPPFPPVPVYNPHPPSVWRNPDPFWQPALPQGPQEFRERYREFQDQLRPPARGGGAPPPIEPVGRGPNLPSGYTPDAALGAPPGIQAPRDYTGYPSRVVTRAAASVGQGAGYYPGAAGVQLWPEGITPGEMPAGGAVAAGQQPSQPAGGAAGPAEAGYALQPPPVLLDRYGYGAWYEEFQRQHEGETPERFYGGAGTAQGDWPSLRQALRDKDYSEGFAEMYGRPPSDYDWKAWYYSQPGQRIPISDAERATWRAKRERQSRKWRRKTRVAAGEEPGGTKMQNFWWQTFRGESPMMWRDFKALDQEKRSAYVTWWREWGEGQTTGAAGEPPLGYQDWVDLDDEQRGRVYNWAREWPDADTAPVTWEKWAEYDPQEQGLVRTWHEQWGELDNAPLTVDDWLGLSGDDRSEVYGWWQQWGYKDNPPVRWREWLQLSEQKRARLYETAGRTTEAEVPKFYPPQTYWRL